MASDAQPRTGPLPVSADGDTIARIEHFRVAPRWLFVRVETAQGIVGWGEATLEGHAEAVEGALDALIDTFVGWPASNIEDIWQHAYRSRFYRGGEVLMSALAGLDTALWDIKGRRLGVPVWELLGGRVRDRLPVYCWIGGDRPSDVQREAELRKAAGFRAVKMNATEDLGWLDSPLALKPAVDRLSIARAAGLDCALDFHGRVHRPMATQLARSLAPLGPLFIEEPLLAGHPKEIADLRTQAGCPVALGERLYERASFRPYLELGAVDIVQPDVAHAGGISETRRIAILAETYDVAFAPHCPNGPISLAASFQLDAVAPNFAIQEMSWKIHYNVGADLGTYIKNPEIFDVDPKDGTCAVPIGAGLGLEVDEEKVRAANEIARAPGAKAWRNPVWRGPAGEFREW